MTKDSGFLMILRFYLIYFLLKTAAAISLKELKKRKSMFSYGEAAFMTQHLLLFYKQGVSIFILYIIRRFSKEKLFAFLKQMFFNDFRSVCHTARTASQHYACSQTFQFTANGRLVFCGECFTHGFECVIAV